MHNNMEKGLHAPGLSRLLFLFKFFLRSSVSVKTVITCMSHGKSAEGLRRRLSIAYRTHFAGLEVTLSRLDVLLTRQDERSDDRHSSTNLWLSHLLTMCQKLVWALPGYDLKII